MASQAPAPTTSPTLAEPPQPHQVAVHGGGGGERDAHGQPPPEDANLAAFILGRWVASFRTGASTATECLYHNNLNNATPNSERESNVDDADSAQHACPTEPCPKMLQFAREVDALLKAPERVKGLESGITALRTQTISAFTAASAASAQAAASKRAAERTSSALTHAYARIDQLSSHNDQLSALFDHESAQRRQAEAQLTALSATNTQLLSGARQTSQMLIDAVASHNEAVARLHGKILECEERERKREGKVGTNTGGETETQTRRVLEVAKARVQRLEFERDLEVKARLALLERYDGVSKQLQSHHAEERATERKLEGLLVVLQRTIAQVDDDTHLAIVPSPPSIGKHSPVTPSSPSTPTSVQTDTGSNLSTPPSSLGPDSPLRTPSDLVRTTSLPPKGRDQDSVFKFALTRFAPTQDSSINTFSAAKPPAPYTAADHPSQRQLVFGNPISPIYKAPGMNEAQPQTQFSRLPRMPNFDEEASLAVLFDEDIKSLTPSSAVHKAGKEKVTASSATTPLDKKDATPGTLTPRRPSPFVPLRDESFETPQARIAGPELGFKRPATSKFSSLSLGGSIITRQPLGPLSTNTPPLGGRVAPGAWRQGPPAGLIGGVSAETKEKVQDNSGAAAHVGVIGPPKKVVPTIVPLPLSLPPIRAPITADVDVKVSAQAVPIPATTIQSAPKAISTAPTPDTLLVPGTPAMPLTPTTPVTSSQCTPALGSVGSPYPNTFDSPEGLTAWFDPEWTAAFLEEELVKRNKFRSRRQRKQFRDVDDLRVHLAKERRERARLEGKRGAGASGPAGAGVGSSVGPGAGAGGGAQGQIRASVGYVGLGLTAVKLKA